MKFIFAVALTTLLTVPAFSHEGDLTLPGAKWFANFTGYVCSPGIQLAEAPANYASLNVKFERMVTDATLDNGLLTASFEESGKECRYSAILFADNAAQTIRFVESKAFAVTDGTECSEGKAVLDSALEYNDYLYYGRPHNLAIMAPNAGEYCGSGLVGINFVVGGKL